VAKIQKQGNGSFGVCMTTEPRPNTGAIFKTPAEKRKSDRSPEYDGNMHVECPHCGRPASAWISAWVKEGKAGKFFSLAFKWKTAATQDETP
jgi:hypothetical protein